MGDLHHARVEIGIAPPFAQREQPLLRLGHDVQEMLGTVVTARAGILALEDVEERDDEHPARGRRRHAHDAMPSVGPFDGRAVADLVRGEILFAEDSPLGLDVLRDTLRQQTFVEGVRPVQADRLQRPREIGLDELVARVERPGLAAFDAAQEDPRRVRIGGEAFAPFLGKGDERRRHLEPVRGERDGGRQDPAQRPLSPALEDLDVPAHRAGNADRERTRLGEVLPRLAVLQVHVRARRGGSHFAEIDHVYLSIARRVDEREAAAADPARLRLDYRKREGRRHRRVERVSAVPEQRRAGLARERMGGRHRAARGHGGGGEDERDENMHGALSVTEPFR